MSRKMTRLTIRISPSKVMKTIPSFNLKKLWNRISEQITAVFQNQSRVRVCEPSPLNGDGPTLSAAPIPNLPFDRTNRLTGCSIPWMWMTKLKTFTCHSWDSHQQIESRSALNSLLAIKSTRISSSYGSAPKFLSIRHGLVAAQKIQCFIKSSLPWTINAKLQGSTGVIWTPQKNIGQTWPRFGQTCQNKNNQSLCAIRNR